ncbi:hypothetical protein E2C01_027177 [Portunus trituberculatus]|uniref:Uncharacterized protein n=1 Tax=Portunus trituberculatus TaxID=210409 RepID=A0A5B7EI30_PORTR|nr:hypothetical protein [Portunus trituberculatus]
MRLLNYTAGEYQSIIFNSSCLHDRHLPASPDHLINKPLHTPHGNNKRELYLPRTQGPPQGPPHLQMTEGRHAHALNQTRGLRVKGAESCHSAKRNAKLRYE